MKERNEKLFYKPSEVCKIADIKPYVLSYWETEFPKLGQNVVKGQKVYTQEELDLILRIKKLLYEEGFTISGAKKQLEKEEKQEFDETSLENFNKDDKIISQNLREVIEELKSIIQWLKK